MFARKLRWLVAAGALTLGSLACQVGVSRASSPPVASPQCASTSPAQIETSPIAGNPCWVDYDGPGPTESAAGAEQQGNPQYPFGVDGNAVDPTSQVCTAGTPGTVGIENRGAGWTGDGQCYQEVTSLAFRSWNRGLAATAIAGGNSTTNAYGVWLYNGTDWFPDPTFPGSGSCPGSTILWAGKLDYWLIGSPDSSPLTGGAGPVTTICHFDGANLYWQVLTLPTATQADLPLTQFGTRVGGITSGTCSAWNNCWFFGTDGIRVHWDGEELSDASDEVSDRPWLQGNFVAASSIASNGGAISGLALNDGQYITHDGSVTLTSVPAQPDGTPAPQAFAYAGSSWTSLTLPEALGADLTNPYQPTVLSNAAQDASGDTWVAAQPADERVQTAGAQTVPLIGVDGSLQPTCEDSQPTYQIPTSGQFRGEKLGLRWTALVPGPNGQVLAGGGSYFYPSLQAGPPVDMPQPELVTGSCGSSTGSPATFSALTFTTQTPSGGGGSVPADQGAGVTAIAAPASNDEWVATGAGQWVYGYNQNNQTSFAGLLAPHLYQYTDGQTPNAPAGDDNEARPSLFTLSPPIYQVSSPTIIKSASVTTTIRKKGKRKQVKLAPAIYGLHTRLLHRGKHYTLRLAFRVRRPVTLGLAVLHRGRIVARTPLERFRHQRGVLSVRLNTKAWPTGLKLLTSSSGTRKPRSR